jgi:hypothetical protein
MRRDLVAWVAVVAGLAGCQPATSRPPFPPAPQAAMSEVRLPVGEATRLLAEAFQADSMPMHRLEVKDAWLETSWFDVATGRHLRGRPLGANTVRVRAWADATHPGSSKVTVETIYRPLADPSLSDRELDRQVPRDHPIAIKVRAALQELVKRYGGPPPPPAPPGAAPEDGESQEVAPGDETPADETPDAGAPSPDEGAPEASSP